MNAETFTTENGTRENEEGAITISNSAISVQIESTAKCKKFKRPGRGIILTVIHGLAASLLISMGAVLVKMTNSDEKDRYRVQYHTFCFSFVCSTHLPFLCIVTGIVVSFNAFSTGLMARKLGNPCCHVTWISISALSSVCLSIILVVGLDDVDKATQHAYMLVVINGCVVELATCAVDVCLLNRAQTNNDDETSIKRTQDRLMSVSSVQTTVIERDEPIYTNTSVQTPTILISEESGRSRNSNRSRESSGRERRASRGQSSLYRFSAGRRRDRSLLHPSHSNRQRSRRRPMLRGQNHYISVPVSYSVASEAYATGSGVASTARSSTRPVQSLPMFIITDCHPAPPLDIQNAETRVKFPVTTTDEAVEQKVETMAVDQAIFKSADGTQENNLESSESGSMILQNPVIPPSASETNPNQDGKKETALLRKKMKNGAVYSIVRRSKEGSLSDANSSESQSPTSTSGQDTNCTNKFDDFTRVNGVCETEVIDPIKVSVPACRGSCDEEKITTFEGTAEHSGKQEINYLALQDGELSAKKKLPNYENIGLTSDAPKLPPRF